MNRIVAFFIVLISSIIYHSPISAKTNIDSIRANKEVIQGTFYVAPAPVPYEIPKSPTEYPDSLGFISKFPEWSRKYLNSLMRGNIDRTHEKALDVGFAITPSYTREGGFGIGGAMTGLYRVNRKDSTMQPSVIFASINVSYKGFYVLTLKGNNLFNDHRSRLSYKTELYQKRLNFWGITSEETAKNRQSQYDRRQIDVQAEYIYKVNRNVYAGAMLRSNYTDAKRILNPEYLLGDRPQYYVTGMGVSLEYDSRNNLLTPTKGLHIAYKPMIYPKGLGNAPKTFFSHTFIANGYFHMWNGAILAVDLYTKLNSVNTPWTMREMLASDGIRMRGYYMGSTIDNNQVVAQIEYRQHLWKRLGMTAWVGNATLFADFDEFKDQNIKPEWLYNFGVGIRYEFKHNVNARIDWGFGEGTNGIVFAIGEAF